MNLRFANTTLHLRGLALQLNATLDQRVTGLFGPSGSGKTTVLELVAGLRRPEQGVVELNGRVLTDVSQGIFIAAHKRGIGYVPQDLALFSHLTVRRNIAYGLKRWQSSRVDLSHEKVISVLEIERLLDRMPASLSGGEKQRVAFARALLASPRLLFFSTNPSPASTNPLKTRILPYLKLIRDELEVPILYVTHSAAEVIELCDEVVVLQVGKCVGRGNPTISLRPRTRDPTGSKGT